MLDENMNAMAALLSDALEYTNQFEEAVTKAQWLDNIGSGKLKHVTFDHKVVNTAHLWRRGGAHRNQNSQAFHAVFVKQGGKWLLVGRHVSAIAER
jgi:hypothetical protein